MNYREELYKKNKIKYVLISALLIPIMFVFLLLPFLSAIVIYYIYSVLSGNFNDTTFVFIACISILINGVWAIYIVEKCCKRS